MTDHVRLDDVVKFLDERLEVSKFDEVESNGLIVRASDVVTSIAAAVSTSFHAISRAKSAQADLLADLACQGREHRLRLFPPSAGQNVRALILEHEHLAVLRNEHRASRHDQLERRLLLGEETRKDKRRHTPNDVSSRDRDQLVDLAQ